MSGPTGGVVGHTTLDILLSFNMLSESSVDFEQEYLDASIGPSDMSEHMSWISDLTSECTHTTELGVGRANSTRAFLRHNQEHHSYEIDPLPASLDYFKRAQDAGKNVTLHIADTREVEIAETDLMLVDSYHSYDQVKKELELHAGKVRKYILFHDTEIFGPVGQGGEKGIWPAIEEFLADHPEWVLAEKRKNCYGMTLIKKI